MPKPSQQLSLLTLLASSLLWGLLSYGCYAVTQEVIRTPDFPPALGVITGIGELVFFTLSLMCLGYFLAAVLDKEEDA